MREQRRRRMAVCTLAHDMTSIDEACGHAIILLQNRAVLKQVQTVT